MPGDVLDSTKGQVINIYDFISNTWTKSYLSQARSFYAMAVVGNKVYYAGGNNGSQKMDVYDASTNSWSIMDFKAARRSGMVAISSGNKIFFAGGNDVRYDSLVLQCDDLGNNCNYYPAWVASKRVDILDVTTNTWSVQYLSEARGSMATAT